MTRGESGTMEQTTAPAARRESPSSNAARPFALEAHPPKAHAAGLLRWLQQPGGRIGTIPADELQLMHGEMCLELEWEPIGWVAVARELRRALGARKEYARIAGRRVRVYRIPRAMVSLKLVQAHTPRRVAA